MMSVLEIREHSECGHRVLFFPVHRNQRDAWVPDAGRNAKADGLVGRGQDTLFFLCGE